MTDPVEALVDHLHEKRHFARGYGWSCGPGDSYRRCKDEIRAAVRAGIELAAEVADQSIRIGPNMSTRLSREEAVRAIRALLKPET